MRRIIDIFIKKKKRSFSDRVMKATEDDELASGSLVSNIASQFGVTLPSILSVSVASILFLLIVDPASVARGIAGWDIRDRIIKSRFYRRVRRSITRALEPLRKLGRRLGRFARNIKNWLKRNFLTPIKRWFKRNITKPIGRFLRNAYRNMERWARNMSGRFTDYVTRAGRGIIARGEFLAREDKMAFKPKESLFTRLSNSLKKIKNQGLFSFLKGRLYDGLARLVYSVRETFQYASIIKAEFIENIREIKMAFRSSISSFVSKTSLMLTRVFQTTVDVFKGSLKAMGNIAKGLSEFFIGKERTAKISDFFTEKIPAKLAQLQPKFRDYASKVKEKFVETKMKFKIKAGNALGRLNRFAQKTLGPIGWAMTGYYAYKDYQEGVSRGIDQDEVTGTVLAETAAGLGIAAIGGSIALGIASFILEATPVGWAAIIIAISGGAVLNFLTQGAVSRYVEESGLGKKIGQIIGPVRRFIFGKNESDFQSEATAIVEQYGSKSFNDIISDASRNPTGGYEFGPDEGSTMYRIIGGFADLFTKNPIKIGMNQTVSFAGSSQVSESDNNTPIYNGNEVTQQKIVTNRSALVNYFKTRKPSTHDDFIKSRLLPYYKEMGKEIKKLKDEARAYRMKNLRARLISEKMMKQGNFVQQHTNWRGDFIDHDRYGGRPTD